MSSDVLGNFELSTFPSLSRRTWVFLLFATSVFGAGVNPYPKTVDLLGQLVLMQNLRERRRLWKNTVLNVIN